MTSAPRGRPRDPSLARRAQQAALLIYAESGLRQVTFDAVAQRTGIGKPALYRRWRSAEVMLLSALAGEVVENALVDTGNVRDDLLRLARAARERLTSESGLAAVRLLVDAQAREDLAAHVPETTFAGALRAARDIVPRAVARGELPQGTSPMTLIEVLMGGILLRILTGSLDAAKAAPLDDAYLIALVDSCLYGVARPGSSC